ncbi:MULTISPECIES: SDR family NAD(P)-dependent oxidoreductase [unclassified Dehalobacter]|uniref:SDR family NAD(P)-dependent oxidoreductase n=1 Tax=unclassified Dehalobacter TaxID=2635733 RepID=UPI0004757FF8|nr:MULTISPECIES: SDR family NAD(P)-dependent oxidoreductase [unclassified Dehalobacter]RJE49074.1 NAD-dependent epimerase [Dehalobacter sp. MCB1]TCX52091.1 KR domain-containing protein [Dehalobacter sp. 14DCB1]TCX53155.1 KR domain-containing protein [Dehalobacter sp. 12DCB1]
MIEGYKELDPSKLYLITGSAGFIGFFLSKKLLEQGCRVVGIDNMNDYYDVNLKESRLKLLEEQEQYTFIKEDISDGETLKEVFEEYKPEIVVNLAAQAGVRYSIKNPDAYIQSNIIGFYNILEACRHNPVQHLVYASSSSVYGANMKVPFSTEDKVDNPVSLYAASKKSNELMAHSYSQLYSIPSTGLRFFTVYGPMGRPDMAYYAFTQKIFNGEAIKVFNYGNCYRDFTYIDDIIESMMRILCNPPAKRVDKDSILDGLQYAVYNIGNNRPEQLMDYIAALEKALSKAVSREIVAKKELLPMQPGDVKATYSDSTPLERDFEFKPSTTIEEGLQRFADWYVDYYRIS